MKTKIALLLFTFSGLQLQAQKEITNELIWYSRTFVPEYVDEVRSMNDGEHFTALDADSKNVTEVNKYAYKDYSKKGTIVNSADVKRDGEAVMIEDYEFNADETKMLIATEIEPVYRRSYYAQYFIYDIKTKTTIPLADPAKGKQMLAEFSPDGKMVAFVRDNNIFIYNLETKAETQVTNDGEKNKIINGTTDWVYEEEFSIVKGFYWSPGSTKIAYYTFNESNVKEFELEYYGSLYPEQYKFKYPKAGEDNSVISLSVYDIRKKGSSPVFLGDETDIYIPRISWTSKDEQLMVLRMDRLQNKLEYCMVDMGNDVNPTHPLKLRPFYAETSETYIDITDDLTFFKNREALVRTSEKSGYNHIYIVDFSGKETQVTTGNWDVTSFHGLDEKKGMIYYVSAESSPMEKDLYSIKTDGSGKKKLSTRKGTNDPIFSNGMKYYINYHSDANTPSFISLHDASGKQLKVLKDNKDLITRMSQYKMNKKEFFKFTTSQNIELNGWMIKPIGFDEKKKYPVYLTFYGGPGKNEVEDAWDGAAYFWHQLLAQKGYMIVCVDPRGTMYRGEKFKKCTYLQLGKYETEDLIETAKYLGNLPYVDKSRIGCQGWSYGGYMTLLCITKGADYFKTGIAVAPVTNWRYYDNIYTERFMRKPQDNADGYDSNSPINHVKKLKGKLLIVHGSADDNVHYQNTLEMTNAFIKAGKQFDMFIYPDRNHGIYGGNTRLHLYNMMTDYVLKNL